MIKRGNLIAAFGIPGSGKSTTTSEIGKILNIATYHEPESDGWGKAVEMRPLIGNFTAIMWFRSIRVPDLFEADVRRNNGETVMIDSYYDKLFYDYHNKEGIEWLFNSNDRYYDEMVAIAKKDRIFLPDADIIVFFKMNEELWREFVKTRDRPLDREVDFLQSFKLQQIFLEVAETYAKRTGCILIVHDQSKGSANGEAKKIIEKINEHLRNI